MTRVADCRHCLRRLKSYAVRVDIGMSAWFAASRLFLHADYAGFVSLPRFR